MHYLAYYATTYRINKYLDMKYWFELFSYCRDCGEKKHSYHIYCRKQWLPRLIVSHTVLLRAMVIILKYVETEYYNWPIRIKYSCKNIH